MATMSFEIGIFGRKSDLLQNEFRPSEFVSLIGRVLEDVRPFGGPNDAALACHAQRRQQIVARHHDRADSSPENSEFKFSSTM